MKKRLGFFVAILIFVIGVLHFYPQISYYIATKAKFSKDKTPKAYVVPEERVLRISEQNFNAYFDIYGDGYKFRSPWKTEFKKSNTSDGLLYSFKQGKLIILHHINKNYESGIQEILNNKNQLSEFDILSLSLNTTPDQITLFESATEISKKASLLVLKALYTSYGNLIYKFSLNSIKGFQFGDPDRNKKVLILFFNDHNKNEYRMSFFSTTQEVIDMILSTITFEQKGDIRP